MYFHKSKYSQLDDLLNRIGEKLQLNSEMKENVSKKYDEVYEVLNKNTDIEGNIYAQGSYALQTTVKPLGRDDFDLDAVVQLDKMWDKTFSAIDLLVLPNSTVTCKGTSIIKLIFSLPATELTFGAKLWNCAG